MAQVALAVVLLAVPTFFGDYNAYQVGLYLLFGIVTQGVALCWGRAGFLGLGQAVFFGLGAYISGFVLRSVTHPALIWIMLLLCVLAPALLAYIVGRLVFAKRIDSGPFFSLITLALAMLAALIANGWSSVTGGFNGLTGIPDLPGTDRYSTLYYVIAACAIAWTAGMTWLMQRPIGVLWAALSQNEDRLQFFGFATDRLKAVAFAISAAAAGFAGALYAPHEGIVTPQSVSILLSAQFVIWAAVGGRRSAMGAQIGALLIGLMSATLRDQYPFWEALMAVLFIGAVLWFSDGLAGAALTVMRRFGIRSGGDDDGLMPNRNLIAPALHYRGENKATTNKGIPEPVELRFSEVSVRRGAVAILNGLDLLLNQRGISCLIGPNGAGKTSSFNAMTGRLSLNSGQITVDAEDVSRYPAWKIARLGIGRKFQIPSVFAQLTVRENLLIALWANRLGTWSRYSGAPLLWTSSLADSLLARMPALAGRQYVLAGALSQGSRQTLEFAMVALMEPRLFLLDEPCAGLSPSETHQLMDSIVWVVDKLNASALLIEHDMSAVEAIGGQVLVLHQGRLLAQGVLAQIKASQEVRAVYAGGHK